MNLLNLACGGTRGSKEHGWLNIDTFDGSHNPQEIFLACDLSKGIPQSDNSADGIYCSHFYEHLTAPEALILTKECYRVLKPRGILRISVPDTEKFYNLSMNHCTDWQEPTPEQSDWMEIALFFNEHKMVLDKYGLFCFLRVSKFSQWWVMPYRTSLLNNLAELDNRPLYSVFVEGIK